MAVAGAKRSDSNFRSAACEFRSDASNDSVSARNYHLADRGYSAPTVSAIELKTENAQNETAFNVETLPLLALRWARPERIPCASCGRGCVIE